MKILLIENFVNANPNAKLDTAEEFCLEVSFLTLNFILIVIDLPQLNRIPQLIPRLESFLFYLEFPSKKEDIKPVNIPILIWKN